MQSQTVEYEYSLKFNYLDQFIKEYYVKMLSFKNKYFPCRQETLYKKKAC